MKLSKANGDDATNAVFCEKLAEVYVLKGIDLWHIFPSF